MIREVDSCELIYESVSDYLRKEFDNYRVNNAFDCGSFYLALYLHEDINGRKSVWVRALRKSDNSFLGKLVMDTSGVRAEEYPYDYSTLKELEEIFSELEKEASKYFINYWRRKTPR